MAAVLKVRNGDLFSAEFEPPSVLVRAFLSARWQFVAGGNWSAPDNDHTIAEADAFEFLQAALRTIESYMEVDLADDDTGPSASELFGRDGLPLDLGSSFIARLDVTEDDDEVPPMTSVGSGRWLSIRQHLAAVALFQLDRATTALREADSRAVAALLWDTHDLFESMNTLDEQALIEDLTAAPEVAAREHGRRGGVVRHRHTAELKRWAVAKAATMRGSQVEIARALAYTLPAEMRNASKDPERLIYDALRAAALHA